MTGCSFNPCDDEAAYTVTVEGEMPVPLCSKHTDEYRAWLEMHAHGASWRVDLFPL